ncbi:MAG: hypothetical protein U0270_30840 [Labilithrix sp.]
MTRWRTSRSIWLWDALWLLVASAVVAYVFWRNNVIMSRVIDGTRYYSIDDDMMISMTYARNLAEGHGLVWNAGGEHVEGYTNFLWTLVMAGVHKLGAPDATASAWVRACSYVFVIGTLIQSVRVVRVFVPHGLVVTPLFLIAAVTNNDIITWAAWGFETALMSFLLMTFVRSVLGDSSSVVAWFALALVPLTRSDGIHIFAACALFGFLIAPEKKRQILTRIVPAALPVIAHFVWRRSYYGDWLPNTYYLKVYLLDRVHHRGFVYARNFLMAYSIICTLAIAGSAAMARRDRRALFLILILATTLLYTIQVGGDMFGSFRFCAHLMPLLYVFAACGFTHVATSSWMNRTAWALAMIFATMPLIKPLDRLSVLDGNGAVQDQMQVAMLIKKNALPNSVVAVIAAGVVPYFSRHPAIDLFGKGDRHIAHLPPYPGSLIGHGKIDPAYSFNVLKPDLVVSLRPNSWVQTLSKPTINTDSYLGVLSSEPFYNQYRPNLVANDFTNELTAIYARQDSPEAARRSTWRPLVVEPPPK